MLILCFIVTSARSYHLSGIHQLCKFIMPISDSSAMDILRNISDFMTIKLDDTNYVSWSAKIQRLLKGYHLLGYIDGSLPCPDSTSESFQQWVDHDTVIMNMLIATITEEAFFEIMNCETSLEAWVTLQERFSSVSEASLMQLKTNLQTIQKGSDSIEVYLSKIKTARQRLACAGFTVTDKDIVLITLNGLPVEYNHFHSHIQARPVAITISELRSLLITEESDISKANTIMKAPMLAAMVVNGLSFSTSSTTKLVLNSSSKTYSSVNSNLSEHMLGSSSQPPYSQGNSYDASWSRGGYTGG